MTGFERECFADRNDIGHSIDHNVFDHSVFDHKDLDHMVFGGVAAVACCNNRIRSYSFYYNLESFDYYNMEELNYLGNFDGASN